MKTRSSHAPSRRLFRGRHRSEHAMREQGSALPPRRAPTTKSSASRPASNAARVPRSAASVHVWRASAREQRLKRGPTQSGRSPPTRRHRGNRATVAQLSGCWPTRMRCSVHCTRSAISATTTRVAATTGGRPPSLARPGGARVRGVDVEPRSGSLACRRSPATIDGRPTGPDGGDDGVRVVELEPVGSQPQLTSSPPCATSSRMRGSLVDGRVPAPRRRRRGGRSPPARRRAPPASTSRRYSMCPCHPRGRPRSCSSQCSVTPRARRPARHATGYRPSSGSPRAVPRARPRLSRSWRSRRRSAGSASA